MKRLILLYLVLISAQAFSQITLDHTHSIGRVNWMETSSSGFKFIHTNLDSAKVTLYNTDHSIWKIINVPAVPNFTLLDVEYVSDNLFDQDGDLEYIAMYRTLSSPYYSTVGIYDESGSKLLSLFDSVPYYPNTEVITDGVSGHKLIASAGQSKIYSLPGTLPCTPCSGAPTAITYPGGTTQRMGMPYPNPAQEHVIIPYELPQGQTQGEISLIDQYGRVVRVYQVDNSFSDLRISTEGMAPGVYNYLIRTDSGIASGGKIIKVD